MIFSFLVEFCAKCGSMPYGILVLRWWHGGEDERESKNLGPGPCPLGWPKAVAELRGVLVLVGAMAPPP